MAVDAALAQNHPEAAPFWAAAEQGLFVLPTCQSCGRAHWYPRAFCPFCFSPDIAWTSSTGKGTIYSYCNPAPAPATQAVVYVKLDDGPMILSHMVDSPAERIAISARVEVVMRHGPNGEPFPAFRLT